MRQAVSLLLVALVAGASACDKKQEILVGEVGSLTGPQAPPGISARNGIELALAEANAAGGVKGKKLAVRVYDSQGRPEEAANAATRLIAQDKVVLLLGDVASSNSLAMAAKAQKAAVPMITHASTHPAVTEVGDYIFRVCFTDPFQGYVVAKFAHDYLKLSNVATLQDSKSAYSLGLTEVFSRKIAELGGRVVAFQSYASGDTDFRGQIIAIKEAKPEAVFVPGYYADVAFIARQARELGLAVPLLGGDGWESERLFELAGDALDGGYFSSHYAESNPEPRLQRFIASYRKAYGGAPDSVAALAYDAFNVALEAMKGAPDLSGPALRDTLARTRDFPGVTGTITFDAKRNALKPAVIFKIHGRKTEFVTTLRP